MTKHLVHSFKDNLREVDFNFRDGIKYIFIFENSYGASVIKFQESDGGADDLWELSVLKNDGYGVYNVTFTTPITDGTLGHLTDEQVNEYLGQIQSL